MFSISDECYFSKFKFDGLMTDLDIYFTSAAAHFCLFYIAFIPYMFSLKLKVIVNRTVIKVLISNNDTRQVLFAITSLLNHLNVKGAMTKEYFYFIRSFRSFTISSFIIFMLWVEKFLLVKFTINLWKHWFLNPQKYFNSWNK